MVRVGMACCERRVNGGVNGRAHAASQNGMLREVRYESGRALVLESGPQARAALIESNS
jgi:hypothetical protein